MTDERTLEAARRLRDESGLMYDVDGCVKDECEPTLRSDIKIVTDFILREEKYYAECVQCGHEEVCQLDIPCPKCGKGKMTPVDEPRMWKGVTP